MRACQEDSHSSIYICEAKPYLEERKGALFQAYQRIYNELWVGIMWGNDEKLSA